VTTTTISVINLKGGSSKTTSAAYVAHAAHEQGRRVFALDADPQASLLHWHEVVRFPFPVAGLASAKLHRDLSGIVGDRFDLVVIDTPPVGPESTPASQLIAHSAALVATHVLVPIAPTGSEYERLGAVKAMLDQAAEMRIDGVTPRTAVLLTRCVPGASATETYRRLIREDGWSVMATRVGNLQRFAQALGLPVERAAATAYGDAMTELLVSA